MNKLGSTLVRLTGLIYTTVTNIFDFLHDFLVPCYPDAWSDCHSQLPGQGWAHSDVEILK